MLLGTRLQLLIGPTVPVPAPVTLVEALREVEVTHKDEGRSGFQITFQVGRSGPTDLVDYPLLLNPLLRPFSRVILVVVFNALPRVLMDGFITNHQLAPGSEPGTGTLTVTGEDVSIMMDLEKKVTEHPAQPDPAVAAKILLNYTQYLLMPPIIVPPPTLDVPVPTERTPVQTATDLEHLNDMARRASFVFYVKPGLVPGQNQAYWGPPVRAGVPQRALSVNMGPASNVNSINFQYDAMAPTTVKGEIQDRLTNQKLPIQTFFSTRVPPLAAMPALPFNLPNVRTERLQGAEGLNYIQAFARAQAITDQSMDAVVTATGELDALRYEEMLQPRGLVGLRGAGFSYDGLYYVKSVTHAISKGEYKQRFTLNREGIGSITPVVPT